MVFIDQESLASIGANSCLKVANISSESAGLPAAVARASTNAPTMLLRMAMVSAEQMEISRLRAELARVKIERGWRRVRALQR